jgi:hypothetical protein
MTVRDPKEKSLPTFAPYEKGSEGAKRNARHAKQLRELAAYRRPNNNARTRGKEARTRDTE